MYEANLHSFQEKLDTLIPLSKNEPVVFYDMEKNIKDIPDLFQKEMEMSPFGVGNEKPVYLIRDFSLSPVQGKFYEVKGKKKTDLKLYNEICNAYGYDLYQKYADMGTPKHLNLLVRLKVNEFRGRQYTILELIDFSSAEEEKKVSKLQRQFSDLLNFTKKEFL